MPSLTVTKRIDLDLLINFSLRTPIPRPVIGCFESFDESWMHITTDHWILKVVRKGYKLHFHQWPVLGSLLVSMYLFILDPWSFSSKRPLPGCSYGSQPDHQVCTYAYSSAPNRNQLQQNAMFLSQLLSHPGFLVYPTKYDVQDILSICARVQLHKSFGGSISKAPAHDHGCIRSSQQVTLLVDVPNWTSWSSSL